MVRKTITASAALCAAGSALAFTGSDVAGAAAQDIDPTLIAVEPEQTAAPAPPVFVTREVVQPVDPAIVEAERALAERDTAETAPHAGSLRELVASVETPATLSEEMRCLAGAVYFEARGEPLAGQLAVAKVVMNRAASALFPQSYCGVVYQRSQFSFVRKGTMPPIRKTSEAWARAKAIAQIAHRGLWDSAAGDSLYFHANYVRPAWSRKKRKLAAINTHIFYR